VATNAVGSTAADSNSLAPVLAPPANTTAPSIPAGGTVGGAVTCDPGTWARALTFAFSWTRDGATIAGATGSIYTLASADAGHTIRCVVVAHGGGGSSAPVTSGALGVGKEAAPTPVAITQIATLPSVHVCVSRRNFQIHLKGVSGIVQAKIQLTGLPAAPSAARRSGYRSTCAGCRRGWSWSRSRSRAGPAHGSWASARTTRACRAGGSRSTSR
jgi:hypothetical protein